MIRCYERSLSQAESQSLQKDLDYARARQKRWKILGLCMVSTALVVGIPLALWQASKDSALGYLAFGTVAVYLVIILWAYWSNTKEDRYRLRSNLWALKQDQARVIRCKSNQVVRIEDRELPSLFFFQVQANLILYCELYQEEAVEKQFPNSDFEVVKVCGQRGELLLLELRCVGEEIFPLRSLEGQEGRDLLEQIKLPQEDFSLMEGRLDLLPGAVPKMSEKKSVSE